MPTPGRWPRLGQLSTQDQERVRVFVEEMRAKRDARDWSRRELSERCGYSVSTVKSVEIYDRPPTPDLARALDRAFETDGYAPGVNGEPDSPGTFMRMMEHIGSIRFPAAYRKFIEYLITARTLRWYEHSYIPGLLQTDAYAEAVLSRDPRVTPEVVKERHADRVERRAILTRENPAPPNLWCLIDESALRRTVGGPSVMADQLAYLLHMAELPNVTLQVVGDGDGYLGWLGAFIIAEAPDSYPSAVYAETAAEGLVMEDPFVIHDMTLRWDLLRTEALKGSDSLTLIERLAEEWKQRQ